mgnify:FL=1
MTGTGKKVILGLTGLVKSIEERKDEELTIVLERNNGYGNFKGPSKDISLDEEPQLGNELLKSELDQTYNIISDLDFYYGDTKDLFDWRADQVLARFGEFGRFFNETQIIPEYNDTMTAVTVSEGCFGKCRYCPEPGKGVNFFSLDQIDEKLKRARKIVEKYHGNHLDKMSEAFANASDLLYNYHFRKNRLHIPDPIQIIKLFYQHFPEIIKMYGFVGTQTVNAADQKYLRELYLSGLNRILIGIETAHNETSRFIGKPILTEKKVNAIIKLQQAGFPKVKAIVQVGSTGKGFYSEQGKFHSSWDALKETRDFLVNVMRKDKGSLRPKDKVIISRYVPIKNTELKQLHDEAKMVLPFEDGLELEEQVRYLESEMRCALIDVEADYEVALEGRIRIKAA